MTTPQKRALIYARVSEDRSGENRSPTRQIESCRHYASARDYNVIAVKQDSLSAYSGRRRPAWDECLQMIKNGEVDVVIAWHMDRMLRSMSDLENLILLAEMYQVGISTVSGDINLTNDVGRMVARILAAVARAEVERKSTRQKLANLQSAREGKAWMGGVRTFGYDRNGDIVPEEATAIRTAAAQVLAGVSLRTIAQQWDEAGLMSTRHYHTQKGWSPTGVKNLLMNPRHVGIRAYLGKEVASGGWDAILDRDTHLLLCESLSDPTRRNGPDSGQTRGRTPTTLLTRLATCNVCDRTVRAAKLRSRNTYSCESGHVTPTRELADSMVEALMVDLLSRPDALSTLIPKGDEEAASAREEYGELRRRASRMLSLYTDGLITEEQFVEGNAMLQTNLTKARDLMNSGPIMMGLDLGAEKVAQQWLQLPLNRKRALIDKFLVIEMFPHGRTRRQLPITDLVTVSYKHGEMAAERALSH